MRRIAWLPSMLAISLGGCLHSESDDPPNNEPVIDEFTASESLVDAGGISLLSVTANDPDGEAVAYTWQATAGEILGEGAVVTWGAPDEETTSLITVSVRDGSGAATTASLNIDTRPTASHSRILVDSSKDGGGWWFPQGLDGFSESDPHQGQALASYLRAEGYGVDELGRDAIITPGLLGRYDRVIRAGFFGSYLEEEMQAYDAYLARSDASLILLSEYLRPGSIDALAERMGLPFRGLARGSLSQFATHAITDGAVPFFYNAGSVILDPASNPDIEVLGWLSDLVYIDLNDNGVQDPEEPTGSAAMGILHSYPAKVFFLGEINGIEGVPQPLVGNLVAWAFGP